MIKGKLKVRITRYTDYSLRVLIYVALKGDRLSTVREVADSYSISKSHLMKIVQQLSIDNYLVAIRGKNGGIRLKGSPEAINIGALVRRTEQASELVDCFGDPDSCVISPSCELRNVLSEALENFFKSLDRYTLADLLPVDKRASLISLLTIEAP